MFVGCCKNYKDFRIDVPDQRTIEFSGGVSFAVATTLRTFRESKKPCRYRGYVVTMRSIMQVEPHTFEEEMK